MRIQYVAGMLMCAGLISTGYSGPEIAVAGNWVQILDGSASPSTANGTNAGNVYIADPNDDLKFVRIQIFNVGDATLELDSPFATFTGTDAADFASVNSNFNWNIPPGGMTQFSLRSSPSAAGTRNAVCHIHSNDANEADFDFAVRAIGVDLLGPALPDLRFLVAIEPPVITTKNTNQGLVYKIKGVFECYNHETTPNQEKFSVSVSLSSDSFASSNDIPGKPKTIGSKLIPSKYKKVKYQFITTQDPTGGAVIVNADSENAISETNELNNREGVLLNLP